MVAALSHPALEAIQSAWPRRNNVAHHYDLDGRLYSLFLDADRQYSCAYFETPDSTLDDAQLAKKRHIAAKLLIRPRDRVLDIGSGWGGLGLYLAEMAGADVTGVTLSTSSSRRRMPGGREEPGALGEVPAAGLSRRRRALRSHRVGRHVRACRRRFLRDLFPALRRASRRRRRHAAAFDRPLDGPDVTSPWITKYIFPGGYIPALSEVMPAIERAGPVVCDIEILRLHYAETLKAWRERFMARREKRCGFMTSASRGCGNSIWLLGNGVPQAKHDGVPDPVDQTPGRAADDARLYRAEEADFAGGNAAQPRLQIAGE